MKVGNFAKKASLGTIKTTYNVAKKIPILGFIVSLPEKGIKAGLSAIYLTYGLGSLSGPQIDNYSQISNYIEGAYRATIAPIPFYTRMITSLDDVKTTAAYVMGKDLFQGMTYNNPLIPYFENIQANIGSGERLESLCYILASTAFASAVLPLVPKTLWKYGKKLTKKTPSNPSENKKTKPQTQTTTNTKTSQSSLEERIKNIDQKKLQEILNITNKYR